ncbi:beta-ketoacyl synthase N-terminal-like domain-containing protein [Nonomuraea sp. NPDC050556]|uniref:beta-ketoacyl synthase N-terminal-like domain-containing protein n=1 Tax=Nonomuraea sp. NPDC050556 TaxID=3364369 RepID=UPI0037A46309
MSIEDPSLDIAVVGISVRLPGASDTGSYWELLRDGRETARRITPPELDAAGVLAAERDDPRYVPIWSGIEGAEKFDAGLFGLTEREASLLDPQHRVFLECAWSALEDASVEELHLGGPVAVYASCGINQYLFENLLPNAELVRATGRLSMSVSSDKDNIATRASYKLGLTGPSLAVQTNCSSALVGLHHAVNALLNYEADAAVVGAASVKCALPRGYRHELDGVNSPDGRCRSFDASANGYFVGDGAGALVLRRRADVEASGDRIYAVIKATAVNNDGAAKVSFTAPSRSGQVAVIRSALRLAAVEPSSVQYVEANGSATLMGDAIEVAALTEAYGDRADSEPLLIGSVKPNIGNLDTASGLASLVKAVLALYYSELPASLHYKEPNPQTGLADGPVRVNATHTAWPDVDGPRRAAVSSFGVGGTNVHVILEQAPTPPPVPAVTPRPALLLYSGDDAEAAGLVRDRLATHLAATGDRLADVAYTTQVGRRALTHRGFALVPTGTDPVAALVASAASLVGEQPQFGLVLAGTPMELAHPALTQRCGAAASSLGGFEPVLEGYLTWYGIARLLADCGLELSAATGVGVGAVSASVIDGRLSLAAGADAIRTGNYPDPAPLPGGVTPLEFGHGDLEAELLHALGTAWSAGVPVHWSALHTGSEPRRVALPGYPFRRVRCWIDPPSTIADAAAAIGPVLAVRPAVPTALVAPRTPLENVIADVWRRRLGIAAVGVNDSFLALGGDSLNAAQVLGELNDLFVVELSLRTFLTSPTVEELAILIDNQLREAAEIRAAFAAETLDEGDPR